MNLVISYIMNQCYLKCTSFESRYKLYYEYLKCTSFESRYKLYYESMLLSVLLLNLVISYIMNQCYLKCTSFESRL